MNVQKQHHLVGDATKEDHAMGDADSWLLMPIDFCSTFSQFGTQKPNDDDFAKGVAIILSPLWAEWDPYNQIYADGEMSLRNVRGRSFTLIKGIW